MKGATATAVAGADNSEANSAAPRFKFDQISLWVASRQLQRSSFSDNQAVSSGIRTACCSDLCPFNRSIKRVNLQLAQLVREVRHVRSDAADKTRANACARELRLESRDIGGFRKWGDSTGTVRKHGWQRLSWSFAKAMSTTVNVPTHNPWLLLQPSRSSSGGVSRNMHALPHDAKQ